MQPLLDSLPNEKSLENLFEFESDKSKTDTIDILNEKDFNLNYNSNEFSEMIKLDANLEKSQTNDDMLIADEFRKKFENRHNSPQLNSTLLETQNEGHSKIHDEHYGKLETGSIVTNFDTYKTKLNLCKECFIQSRRYSAA